MAEKKTFEKTMAELESVVEELENGSPELARALELYEKGVKLAAELKKELAAAEEKLTVLGEKGAEEA